DLVEAQTSERPRHPGDAADVHRRHRAGVVYLVDRAKLRARARIGPDVFPAPARSGQRRLVLRRQTALSDETDVHLPDVEAAKPSPLGWAGSAARSARPRNRTAQAH